MKNGIHVDVTRDQYDLLLDRVNYSTLKILGQQSAQHYKHALDTRPKSQDELEEQRDAVKGRRDALLRGEATHVAALEPGLYDGRFVVYEGTRDARHHAFKEVLGKAALGRQKVITTAMHEVATNVAKAVRSNPEAAPYIVGGHRETTVCWDYEEPQVALLDGWTIPLRCRLDYLTDVAILDLKTTVDASPDAFAKQMWNLGSFMQAAMQQDGVAAVTRRVRPYFWLAVEVEAPYACALYEPSKQGLELGRRTYQDWLRKLHVHQQDEANGHPNPWPGYTGGGVMQLDPPRWALPREEFDA
jgi:hypothetical protein